MLHVREIKNKILVCLNKLRRIKTIATMFPLKDADRLGAMNKKFLLSGKHWKGKHFSSLLLRTEDRLGL